jgi:two-component system, NtrC family, sensor histidine kinase HydH
LLLLGVTQNKCRSGATVGASTCIPLSVILRGACAGLATGVRNPQRDCRIGSRLARQRSPILNAWPSPAWHRPCPTSDALRFGVHVRSHRCGRETAFEVDGYSYDTDAMNGPKKADSYGEGRPEARGGPGAVRATLARLRWGWVATTTIMGLAFIGVAWSNYQRVLGAATTLDRGQAVTLRLAVERAVRTGGGPELNPADVVVDQSEEGLRFLALYDEDGNLIARSGIPAGDVPRHLEWGGGGRQGGRGADIVTVVGDRTRLVGGSPGPPDRARRRGDRAGFRVFLFEFEPRTTQLTRGARQTFLLSGVAAITLIFAGGVFWRMSQHREQFERQLEQQRRLSVLGEMAAVLAHEIRNPLASLKGHAQLLAERLDAGERPRADRIVNEAGRLELLTANLLDFARGVQLERLPIDPVALLRTAIDDVDPSRIDMESTGQVPRWSLDSNGMRQVLANVLRNAVQASERTGRVQAHVTVEDELLTYVVRDHGPGLPPGEETKIFEPFVTTRATGAGLGLAVAMRVVQLHGGTILAANHPDGGAVFRIAIPAE